MTVVTAVWVMTGPEGPLPDPSPLEPWLGEVLPDSLPAPDEEPLGLDEEPLEPEEEPLDPVDS